MKRKNREWLGGAQREFLVQLGLSEDAIELYQKLLQANRLTAAQAAGDTGKYPSAQYRLFYHLEQYGLARRYGGRPRSFTAVEPELAFPIALRTRQAELDAAFQRAIVPTAIEHTANLRLLTGKQALYDEYPLLAAQATHSIDLYTIGIAYSPKLVAVQRSARERGIGIRHVVQEVKLSNLHVITTWRNMGVELRKNRAERGFHLMVFDEKLAIASFSSPADTEDRLSIVTDNPAALDMFRRYFEQLWQQSSELSL